MMPDDAIQKVKVPPPLIVKIGGSLAENDRIGGALDIVARASRRLVVVPGGGVFADTVRSAQADYQFSDEAAHRMAILAMHQTAELLMDLQPRLMGADSVATMRAIWRKGKLPVWQPHKMCDGDNEIPANWSITSDGLAARLAERMRCSHVVLVKSRNVDEGASAFDLGARGRGGCDLRGDRDAGQSRLDDHWSGRGSEAGADAGLGATHRGQPVGTARAGAHPLTEVSCRASWKRSSPPWMHRVWPTSRRWA